MSNRYVTATLPGGLSRCQQRRVLAILGSEVDAVGGRVAAVRLTRQGEVRTTVLEPAGAEDAVLHPEPGLSGHRAALFQAALGVLEVARRAHLLSYKLDHSHALGGK